MRCLISGLGLLACRAACLPHRVVNVNSARPRGAACCPRMLEDPLPGVVVGCRHHCSNSNWQYPCGGGGCSRPSAFIGATTLGPGSRQRCRRQIGSYSSSTARRRRVSLLRACSSEASADAAAAAAGSSSRQDSKNKHPSRRPSSVVSPSTSTTTTTAVTPTTVAAVVIELQPRAAADTETLAVYGKLHRLLGTTRSRQLLGLEAVATLTSSNYLVLHARDGTPSLYNDDGESSREEGANGGGGGCGGWGGGARLALGDRCWDICGIGQGVSFGACDIVASRPRRYQSGYLEALTTAVLLL